MIKIQNYISNCSVKKLPLNYKSKFNLMPAPNQMDPFTPVTTYQRNENTGGVEGRVSILSRLKGRYISYKWIMVVWNFLISKHYCYHHFWKIFPEKHLAEYFISRFVCKWLLKSAFAFMKSEIICQRNLCSNVRFWYQNNEFSLKVSIKWC